MKKFIKLITLSVVTVFVLAIFTFSGCGLISGNLWTDVSYDNESAYTIGGGEIAESISDIEVKWADDSVTVAYYDGTSIKIEESADKEIEEKLTLRYLVENGKLTVQFATNGRHDIRGLNKKLNVLIPTGVTLNKLTIKSVSGNVNSTVAVAQLFVNTVGGNVTAESVIGGASVNTISGNIDVTSSGLGFQVASVSGNIKLTLSENLTQANISSASGTIDLSLPESLGFKLTFSKLGGNLNSTLDMSSEDMSSDGKTYTRLDGKATIEINCVLGNVNVSKNG